VAPVSPVHIEEHATVEASPSVIVMSGSEPAARRRGPAPGRRARAGQRIATRTVTLVAGAMLLAAGCGGETVSTFKVSAERFSLVANEDGAPPQSRYVDVTVIGDDPVYLAVFYGGPAISEVYFEITGPRTARITVVPAVPSEVHDGIHAGEVVVIGCADEQCNREVKGSPKVIPVSYEVRPGPPGPDDPPEDHEWPRLASESLAFEARTGVPLPADQWLPIDAPADLVWTLERQTSYENPDDPPWLSVGAPRREITGTAALVFGVAEVPVGTYSAQVDVSVNVRGYTRLLGSVTVTYTVWNDFSLSTDHLQFHTYASAPPPPPQTVEIEPLHDYPTWHMSATVTTDGEAADWISLDYQDGELADASSISVTVAELPPGHYEATLTLETWAGDIPSVRTVEITHDVAVPFVLPSDVAFSITRTSSPADFERTVPIARPAGAPMIPFSAVVEGADWLSVTPASGDTGDASLQLTLRPDVIAEMENGSHQGRVLVASEGVLPEPVVLPVSLSIDLSQVDFVAPHVAVTGSSDEVILRGSRLEGVPEGALRFGDAPALSIEVVSDTEIRAVHPALPAGSHPVIIDEGNGISRVGAALRVLDPVTLPAAIIPVPGLVGRIVFDDLRNAIYVCEKWERVHVFTWQGGTAWSADAIDVPQLRDIALTPDGEELLVMSDEEIDHYDPDDWTILATASILTDRDDGAWHEGNYRLFDLVVANDGTAIVGTDSSNNVASPVYFYDIDTRRFRVGPNLYLAHSARSGDGSLVMVSPGRYYDASTGELSLTDVPWNPYIGALDRTGDRILTSRRLFDGGFAPLGDLSDAFPGPAGAALSPDGRTAYAHWVDELVVRVYDVSGPGFNPAYPQIAQVPLAGDPGGPSVVRAAMSMDGRTLFLAGSTGPNVVIVPLP
jgi:hypothetical protein